MFAPSVQRTASLDNFPPSRYRLLDDLQSGRSLEVEPLLGNLVRVAKALEFDMPYLRYVVSCHILLRVENQKKMN